MATSVIENKYDFNKTGIIKVKSAANVPIKIPCNGYGNYLLFGYQQGYGSINLRIRITGSASTLKAINFIDGQDFTQSNPVFSYANNNLSITDVYGNSSYIIIGTSL